MTVLHQQRMYVSVAALYVSVAAELSFAHCCIHKMRNKMHTQFMDVPAVLASGQVYLYSVSQYHSGAYQADPLLPSVSSV
jgi:hypothetical protein